MASVNATNARKNLYRLIQDVNENHEPVVITGNRVKPCCYPVMTGGRYRKRSM